MPSSSRPWWRLSHRALRELVLEFGGLDFAYTEMASAGAAVSGSPYEECYLDRGPAPEKVVYQLYAIKPRAPARSPRDACRRPARSSGRTSTSAAPRPTSPRRAEARPGCASRRGPSSSCASARAAWDRSLSAKIRLGAGRGLREARRLRQGPRRGGRRLRRPPSRASRGRSSGARDDGTSSPASPPRCPCPSSATATYASWSDYRRRREETEAARAS